MEELDKELVEHIQGYPEVYNAKELYHLLWGMGVLLSEEIIQEILDSK